MTPDSCPDPCQFYLLIFAEESPAEGDNLWVDPVFHLVRVDHVVQLGILHPSLGVVEAETYLGQEKDFTTYFSYVE